MKYCRLKSLLAVLSSLLFVTTLSAQDDLPKQADRALRKAVEFYRTKVSSHGGYLYQYSADLSKREGEGNASVDTVWVQPPGTPTVGMAYLDAYELTGEQYLLDAARAAGECLIQGQLRSGCWDAKIEFAPDERKKIDYRTEPERPKTINTSSYDDDKSQSAMRLLIRLDEALGFKDERLHEATMFALDSTLKAQFPNGAWPQLYAKFPDPADYPVKKASYPDSWPREFPGVKYSGFYTFNDNAIADVIDVMFLAHRVYGAEKYLKAAEQAGDFILLAQMPEPQPAWAQQYDLEMHPAWARKFEPPAVTGGESQGVMLILLDLFKETGKRKYLEPIPRALKYLQSSKLPSGQLARFYELKTNRPLYFTKSYVLTYDDSDIPTHYGFKVDAKLDRIEKEYERLAKLSPDEVAKLRTPFKKLSSSKNVNPHASQAKRLIAALDDRGAWVEDGELKYQDEGDDTRRIISSRTFVKNLVSLARYVGATRGAN